MVVTVDDNGVCTHASMRGGCIGPLSHALCRLRGAAGGEEAELCRHAGDASHYARSDPGGQPLPALVGVLQKNEGAQGVFKKLFADILGQLGIEEVQE